MNRRQGRRRFGGRGGYASWAALPIFLLATLARAQSDAAFELRWTAPRACPDERSVRRQVSRLAPSPAARERPLRVEGTVRERDAGFALDLVLQEGRLVSRRHFESDSCTEVVGAAAVAIALLLTGEGGKLHSTDAETGSSGSGSENESVDGATGGSERAHAPTDEGGSTRSATDSKRQESKAEATRAAPGAIPDSAEQGPAAGAVAAGSARAWRFLLAAPTGSAGLGFLSTPSLALGLGLGFEAGLWRLLLSGNYHPELELELAGSPGRGARVKRRTLRVSACRWMTHRSFQWAPCATLGLERLVARGVGSDVSIREADFTWIAAGPSGIARVRVSHWVGLTAQLGVEVQTARPALVIEGLGEVERVGALELSGSLGAEWIF